MFSTQRRFADDEWERLDAWLDRVYDDFTSRACAHDLGLVDVIGGLTDALDLACDRSGLRRDAVTVRVLPHHRMVDRIRPPSNSEHPAAAVLPSGAGLVAGLLNTMGLGGYGVLTMPVTWELA